MAFSSPWLRKLTVLAWTIGLANSFPASAQEVDPEEAAEATTVAKFVTVLEKGPKRGTALDKVYGYHVERGSLDGLINRYRDKASAAKGAEAGPAWMITGLLESLRGQDAASVEAFAKAEQVDATNYLAPYYLGQALVLVGQPDKAAEALERSIGRKPAPADQLEIYQALGRVYQRAQKNDKALEVWNRLEKQFPNDARVQEQIAVTLLEENEFAAALPRFENLAKTSKDKYRQSQFQMEAAEIKVRLGKTADAIKEFEKLLGQLNPDNWLFREVRRRIENIYMRTDDQAGLIAYYEAWTKKNPEDLEAISRLARLLAGLGRGAEAQTWLEKGLKAAPSKKELRHALISQLMYEQKFPDVIAQYEQLDKYEPNNPDTLRDWGRVILKDTKRDEATRRADAAAVWRRLTASKPKDPLIASQVAELFRHAEMTDEALVLYRKAIDLAPESAQYKEYLGEYFHSLQRKDEALATWRQMSEGKAKTAANLARLAEVLAGFGYLSEAVETNAEACKLDPKEINLQIKQADLLSQAGRHEDTLKQLAVIQKLAANDEEREAWIQRELKELQALEQLKDRIAAMQKELTGLAAAETEKDKLARADKWFWLARANEAERQLKDAAEAVTKASDLAPQSIPILMSSARILEAQNNLLAAVDTNTKLAAIDRRYRTEYLKKVAQLEVQLGRRDKAIQAGRDLLAAAPGNPELYEFFSQLCFQLGQTEEGLQALRRSVRVNPTEPKGLLLLASALGDQFRTGEAIELYWRAFEKAGNLEDRLSIVPRLAQLYLQTNQLDRLLERLERQRRDANQQREMTICLAQAYQAAGDDGSARQELEKLLTEDTRDTQLLMQLVKLCETDGDFEAAVRFQQQLSKVAPGKETTMRLAQLLMKSGESEEATALMTRITAEEKDPEQLIKSIDSLLTQKNFDQALGVIERLVRDQPTNWEYLYREGAALASTKPAEAARRFEAILILNLKDDEETLIAKNQAKKAQGRMRTPAAQFREMNPFIQRAQYLWQIRQAVGLDQNNRYYGGGIQQQQPFFAPHDFGTARMASIAWLNQFATTAGKEEEFVKQRRDEADKSTDRRVIVDWYYLATLRQDSKDQYVILKKLSLRPDADIGIKSMYLTTLAARGGPQSGRVSSIDGDDEEKMADLEPLGKDEMEHVLACYKELDDATSMINYGETFLEVVVAELKRAGRTDEAEKMLHDSIDGAKSPVQIAMVLAGAVQRGDYATAIKLLDRMAELKPESATPTSTSPNAAFNYTQYVSSPQYQSQILGQLMALRAQKKELKDVLALWDRYLALAVTRYDSTKSAPAAKKRNANVNPYGQQGYYQVWRGTNQQGERIDFPSPNDIYDHASLQMLRQAFVVYKDDDIVKDLIDHFQNKLKQDKLATTAQLFWKLGLGYLHWWNDDKDDALTQLTEVAALLPGNEEMTFELVSLHEKRGDAEQALALIESMPTSDQQTMQRREITALRLSVNSGNIDRARTAAERLFGLRLDSNLQIALARQMHQLAMHEQAEAVLARAGRQAGNKTDVLMNLMQQYQSQGKNDVATQIAHQLLRRSSSSGAQAAMGGRGRAVRDESGARQQALLVMKRSGKLPEMIKKVEDQLTHSPKSQRLLETLIEYYTAEGNQKKVAELSAKYAETKGDDPQFRYQLAMQLVRAGKHQESLEHFKAALKKEPRLLRNSYWEMQNAFENADKLDELATLYEELDLKSFRQNAHELTNLISNMSNRDKTKDRAVILFKKAWKELPDERPQLLSNLNSDVFWKMPEIYDYARQGIIPTESSLRRSGQWPGFGNIQSYHQDGKMTTMLSRFLTIATQSKKLDELADEVALARKNLKGWQSGEPLAALIDLRRGRVNEAKATFEKLLPTMKVQIVGHYAHWEIAEELMTHETCVDLAILYLEAAVKDPDVISGNEFTYTPGKSLVTLYKQRGRKEDARRVIMDAIKGKSRDNYDQQYETYRRLRNVISLGKEIRTLGYPVDAIRLYQESLAKTEDLTTAQRYGGDNIKTELQNGFQAALKDLKPELLPELLMGSPDATGGKAVEVESVDLVLLVDSRELDKTSMSSALGKLVVELVKKPDMVSKTKQALADVRAKRPDDVSALILAAQLSISSKDAENSSAIVKQLVDLIDRTPLEPQPAKGGFTSKQKEAARRQTALWLVARDCLKQESLRPQGIRLAERALEASRRNTDQAYLLAILREWGQIALETGDRKTAEERWTEMLDTVIPKPVDKGKKKDDAKTSMRPGLGGRGSRRAELAIGSPIVTRGSAGASPSQASANARSRGQVFKFHFWPHNRPPTLTSSRDSNPRRHSFAVPKMKFEDLTPRPLSRWEQLLAPALVGQVAAPAPAVRTRATAAIPGGPKGGVVTLAQFEQAAQIAKLAADNGLLELSLKAMTQALHSGPPIVAMEAHDQFTQSGFPAIATQQVGSEQSAALQAALQKVEQRLTSIETIWRKKGVDDKTVYLLLKQAVLPEGRPQEVFLYPRPLANNPNQQPQSVGLLLVQVAVRANQTEDLKETIALRLKQPLGELPARILATQLALASKDSAAAREQIEALSTRLKMDSLQYSNELACHVAIPAMSLPDLPPAAVTLLERAVEHFTQNTQQGKNASQEEPMRTFRFALARFHFQNGNVAAGKKHLQDYMTFLVPLYARYGGDYGQHRRRLEMLKLAAEFSRAGLQTDTLDCLAQYADLPLSRNYGQEGAGRAGALILASLAQLPPAEQYELLKTWTLPTSDRLSLRVFAGLIPGDQAPSTFDALRGTVPRGPRNAHLHSTADLLVSAARQTGKLDELREELQPHADKNVENATFMLLMTRIAQGEGAKVAPALSEYLDERRKALPNQGDSQKRPQLLDAVLALSAMHDPALLDRGQQLGLNFFIHCSRVQDHQFMVMMRHDFNGSMIGDGLTAQLDRDQSQPGLKHWTAGATFPARTDSAGAMPMWWIAHEGVISHVCGPDLSNLYFKYPLTGTFEVSCEGWLGSWAEANVGFGGMAFQTLNLGNDVTIFPIGNRGDVIHKPDPLENRDHYNRLSVKVDPENIRHYVNGYLIHTVPNTGTTSPWYFLHSGRVWQTCFRNIQIKGDPQIPREVQLSQGDTLLGWCTDFYGETQPPRSAAQAATGEAGAAQPDTDWNSKDGIIHGRFLPSTGFGKTPVQQSRLYYGRPLLDGERLRYEFWYEAGAGGSHVHPAFDRLALLLDPEGVKLHWMTDGAGPEDAYSGLVPENVTIDKSIQRGKLLLKDQSWNAVEIELKDGVATLALNGSIVAARPMEPENNRLFGFYHDKNFTSVKVRNVVLSGDWPKTLSPELLADVAAPASNRTDAERRKLGEIIEEKFYATDLDWILKQTSALPPKKRYQALKNWVLPNEDHGSVRVYADTAQSDPVPVTPNVIARVDILDAKSAPAKQKALPGSPGQRQRTGGELIAPVLDLVAVAKQLDKLDELADQVRKVPESPEQVKRSRLALLALIAIAANDFKQAESTLKEMTVPRDKGLPDTLSLAERWPEYIVASEASRVPELRNASIALLELLTDSVNRKGIGTPWDSKVRSARQQALVQRDRKIDLPTASSVSPKRQWTQATQLRASTRANGLVPRWHFQGAESLHIGGEGSDYLYFQSPLRGTFTVEGEFATFGWREPLMMYAAQFACPQYSLDCATIGNLYTQWAGPKFAAKIQLPGDWYRFKMEVTPDKVAYYANEQWFHENLLTDNSDPWLAIHSMAQYATATRSLRISGTPEIPAQLQLSSRDDLQGWWAGMYEDPMSDSDPAWKKMGNEIVGQKYASWDGRSRESLLQYHRPMLEDGQISYEFLHGPETHVHPALDRMVLLLADDGVKVHWLTDAQYERGGLTPDNVTVEKEHRRGPAALPLKANDWNAVALNLKGDTLTLTLNGELVYERPVDPTNLRTFGLFHYETEVRVRNVVYKGNWPKTLPTIKEQELARDDLELVTFKDGELPATYSWNFQGRQPLHLDNSKEFPTTKRTPVEGGIKIVRESNSDPLSDAAGFQWAGVEVGGDFEITLGYRDFVSSTKSTTNKVPRIEIILALGGGFSSPQHCNTLALTHSRMLDDSMRLTSYLSDRRKPPVEDWQAWEHPLAAAAGRIRIVRRGATVYYLQCKLDSEEWKLYEQRPVATVEVKDMIFGLRSEDLVSNASVVFTEFSVRAKQLKYVPRFSDDDLPGKLAWNFKGSQPQGLQALGTEEPNTFEAVPVGIKINRPEAPDQKAGPVGYKWQGKLSGDFEVTLAYRDFDSATDKTDWQAPRLEIHIPIGAPTHFANSAVIAIRRRPDEQTLATGIGEPQPDGQRIWRTTEQKTGRTGGRLRLSRVGATIHALIASSGSDDFVPISSNFAGTDDITSMTFAVRSESQKSRASFTLTELSIRAQKLDSDPIPATDAMVGPAPFRAKDLPAKASWNFQGAQPGFLLGWGPRNMNSVVSVPDGMKVIRIAKVNNSETVIGYMFDGTLHGDFEITLDYRDFESVPVATDWRAPRVDISAAGHSIVDPTQSLHGMGLAHRRGINGDLQIVATQGDKGADGKVNYKTEGRPTGWDRGRLRLTRQGSIMFYQYAPLGTEKWVTIKVQEIDPGPVKNVSFGVRAEDLEGSGEAVLTNVTISAREIVVK